MRFLFLVAVTIMLNLLILDVVLIKQTDKFALLNQLQVNTLGATTATACPQSCITKINQAMGVSTSASKEYFVPIGSGTWASEDWEDVPGLQVEVDTARYGRIKNAYFEASVHVPNANQIVFVRLYNVTDKHPVWSSELSFNNAGTAQSQTSPSITLGIGQKAYKVQIKTQLKYTTNVTSSRIRILTQ